MARATPKTTVGGSPRHSPAERGEGVMTSDFEASDPSGADVSTSHERASGRSWDATYRDADPAPWDIGRPQAPFVRIASERGFAGPVLDAGCGTGEHALLAASLGVRVLGVDLAATAVS